MNRVFTPYINHAKQCLALMDLQSLINAERLGLNSNIEGGLRQRLQSLGGVNQLVLDILYGNSIPFEVRKKWQELGMDPESEDEVYNYMKQYSPLSNKNHLIPPFVATKPSPQ